MKNTELNSCVAHFVGQWKYCTGANVSIRTYGPIAYILKLFGLMILFAALPEQVYFQIFFRQQLGSRCSAHACWSRLRTIVTDLTWLPL